MAAALALTVSGCVPAVTDTPPARDAAAVQVTPPPVAADLSGSWTTGYPRLADLTRAADVVVVGTVLPGARTSVVEGLPFLDTPVAVTRWVAGRAGVTGTLTIRQTGGVVDGRAVTVEDDPLLRAGERAVFFLDQAVDGRRAILSGPTGRLIVDDDERVRTLPGTSLTEPLPPTLTAVVAAIRASPSSSRTTPARR
ncbi:hypothetical protein V6N00_14280 [Tersicoccus sp. MR15.9]|uniref:hypothetical protein n=1 Tax=Tersicoccus mangrovi TaxID=3121635 RepID=UPI002FE59DCA